MHKIALGLAGAVLAAGALAGTARLADAQPYYGYPPPPAYYVPAYPPGYVYRPAPDRGSSYSQDPLQRYYVPGYAPNASNPTVTPSYQAPHVDDGTINRKGGD